jgi:hypothetical protein
LKSRRKYLLRAAVIPAAQALDPTGTAATAASARQGVRFIPKARGMHGIDTWLPMAGLGMAPPAPDVARRPNPLMDRTYAFNSMTTRSRAPRIMRRRGGMHGLPGLGAFDLKAAGTALVDTVSSASLPIKQETYKGWDIYFLITGKGADGKPAGRYTAVKAGSPGPSVGAGGFESDVLSVMDIRSNIDKYGTPYPPAESTGVQIKNWFPWILGGVAAAGVLTFMMMKRKG